MHGIGDHLQATSLILLVVKLFSLVLSIFLKMPPKAIAMIAIRSIFIPSMSILDDGSAKYVDLFHNNSILVVYFKSKPYLIQAVSASSILAPDLYWQCSDPNWPVFVCRQTSWTFLLILLNTEGRASNVDSNWPKCFSQVSTLKHFSVKLMTTWKMIICACHKM